MPPEWFQCLAKFINALKNISIAIDSKCKSCLSHLKGIPESILINTYLMMINSGEIGGS